LTVNPTEALDESDEAAETIPEDDEPATLPEAKPEEDEEREVRPAETGGETADATSPPIARGATWPKNTVP
jgi:hypothetical protein